jgi:hypothetical protein
LNETKRLILIALVVGLAVFFIEDMVCCYLAYNNPGLFGLYFKTFTVSFYVHGVTIPSVLWLLILVYAVVKPEKKLLTQAEAASSVYPSASSLQDL